MRPYLKKTHHKKGLVEWLKVQTLSSSPSTAKKKKNKKQKRLAE
jgi:ribosomal protein S21